MPSESAKREHARQSFKEPAKERPSNMPGGVHGSLVTARRLKLGCQRPLLAEEEFPAETSPLGSEPRL